MFVLFCLYCLYSLHCKFIFVRNKRKPNKSELEGYANKIKITISTHKKIYRKL